MIRSLLVAWLCAFSVVANAAFGVSMLGCMLRLGNSALWKTWKPAFVAAARSTFLVAVFYIPVLLGMHVIYPWISDAEFANQRWFLDTPFAVIRAIVYFTAWIAAGRLARSEGKSAIAKTAAALVILFFTANLAAVDWLMALTPKWHSSVFGLRWVVNGLLIGAAAIVCWQAKADTGTDNDAVRRRIDGANVLFALNLGWLYLMFVDYITAWSGNLPDEAKWYIVRSAGGWLYVISAIVACHILACAILLARGAKRSASTLLGLAALTVAMQWLETVWTVAPGFDMNTIAMSLISLVILALFTGAAGLATHPRFVAAKKHEVRADG